MMNGASILGFLLFFAHLISLQANAQLIPSTIGEIYNFEPGDTFEYSTTIISMTNTLGCNSIGYEMIVVLNKQVDNDSAIYQVNISQTSSWNCNYHNGGSNSSSGIQTLIYTNLDSSIFWNHAYNPFSCDSISPFCHYDTVYTDQYLNNRKVNKHWEGIHYWIEADTSYAEGLGVLIQSYSNEDIQHQQGGRSLIYYHKATGEKWGYPHYFTVTGTGQQIEDLQNFVITPNPVVDKFRIQPKLPFSETLNFKLYNAIGRMVMCKRMDDIRINITRGNLSEGVYFWQLESQGKLLSRGKILLL